MSTAAAAPATTAATAAWTGDGLSPDTRLASAPLSTPDIDAQLRPEALRLVVELELRFDELPPLLRLLELPLRVRLVAFDELGFDAAALRVRPDFDELDERLEEPDPRLDEPDPRLEEEPDPRFDDDDPLPRELSAWRLKRSVRDFWLSSSSSSCSSGEADSKMSSTSE